MTANEMENETISDMLDEPRIYDNILDTMGNTPLVRLNRVSHGVRCQIVAKVEYLNPGGSVKDRIGLAIIEDAEKHGKLKPVEQLSNRHQAIRVLDWRWQPS